MSMNKIRITVWNEFIHERVHASCKKVYPSGMHETIAAALRKDPVFEVRTATMNQKDHGLPQSVLDQTDVLIWWGHAAHGRVKDKIVDRVYERVLKGMGLIVLHSGHMSKPFRKLMGTSCCLRWREAAEREFLWVVNPYHPITQGLDPVIEIPNTEMYGEFFDVPKPDDIIFISNFEGGDVFRSGMTWTRGLGKIFYFRPGHETYPIYHHPDVQKVIANACKWLPFAGNTQTPGVLNCPHVKNSQVPFPPKDYKAEPTPH
jgi:trehalose utilization protein